MFGIKMLKFFEVHNGKLMLMSYVMAFIWTILISLPIQKIGLNHQTYISENALLPGLVKEKYQHNHEENNMAKIYNILLNTYNEANQANFTDFNFGIQNITNTLMNKINDILLKFQIEVYSQNFYGKIFNTVINGTNIHAIKRAIRTPSYDGIILYTALTPFNEIEPHSHPSYDLISVSALLSLMQYLTMQNDINASWIAKDIVIMISSHDTFGPLAWTQSYYHEKNYKPIYHFINKSILLNYDDIKGPRLNYLQAALCLTTHYTLNNSFTHLPKFVSIKFEGLGNNGRLPNLDLLNMAYQIAEKHNLDTPFNNINMLRWIDREALRVRETLKNILKVLVPSIWRRCDMHIGNLLLIFQHTIFIPIFNLLTSIVSLSRGSNLERSHAFFASYGVDSISAYIYASSPSDANYKHSSKFSGPTFCRFLEGVVRSLNNLHEKFHQSYFFYLLLSGDRFVSIASYYPIFVFLSLPLIIHCLIIWQVYAKPAIPLKDTYKHSTTMGINIKVNNIWKPILVNHMIGIFVYLTVRYTPEIISLFTFLLIGLSGFFSICIIALVSVTLLYKSKLMTELVATEIQNTNVFATSQAAQPKLFDIDLKHIPLPIIANIEKEYNIARLVTIIELLLGLYALSLFNYSLALSLVSTQSLHIFYGYDAWKTKRTRDALILILSCPFTIFLMLSIINHSTSNCESMLWSIHKDTWNTIISDRLFVSHNLRLLTLFVLPVWIFFAKI